MYKKIRISYAVLLFGSSIVLADEKKPVANNAVKNVSVAKKEDKNEIGIKDIVNFEGIRIKVFEEPGLASTDEGAEIQKYYEEAKKDIVKDEQEAQKKIADASSEFTAKQATLSEEARIAEQKKLAELERGIRMKCVEKRQKLEADMMKKMEDLSAHFEESVAQYGKDKDMHLIFTTSGKVVYMADEYKCTDDVAKKMNEARNKRVAQNKKDNSTVTTTAKAAVTSKKANA